MGQRLSWRVFKSLSAEQNQFVMTPPKIVLQLSLVHSDGVAKIECSRMSGKLVACVPLGAEIRDVRALLDVVHAVEGRHKKVL